MECLSPLGSKEFTAQDPEGQRSVAASDLRGRERAHSRLSRPPAGQRAESCRPSRNRDWRSHAGSWSVRSKPGSMHARTSRRPRAHHAQVRRLSQLWRERRSRRLQVGSRPWLVWIARCEFTGPVESISVSRFEIRIGASRGHRAPGQTGNHEPASKVAQINPLKTLERRDPGEASTWGLRAVFEAAVGRADSSAIRERRNRSARLESAGNEVRLPPPPS